MITDARRHIVNFITGAATALPSSPPLLPSLVSANRSVRAHSAFVLLSFFFFFFLFRIVVRDMLQVSGSLLDLPGRLTAEPGKHCSASKAQESPRDGGGSRQSDEPKRAGPPPPFLVRGVDENPCASCSSTPATKCNKEKNTKVVPTHGTWYL